MKILSISLDRALLDPHSAASLRQRAYYQNSSATVLVLATGSTQTMFLGETVMVRASGGRLKMGAFWNGLVWLWHARKESYEIVSAQDALFTGMAALFFARLRQIPYVVQLHGDYLDNPLWTGLGMFQRIQNVMGKAIVRHADGVRCVSERIRKYVLDVLRVPAERCISLPICTPLETFVPSGDRMSDGPFVLFVGRLIEEKSPLLFCETVIPLMQEMPNLVAVIAGEGHLKETMCLRFAAKGLQDRVRFVGQLSASALATWYRSSVCLVHTAAWEGWGMPMIEAMACGCPVVTTDTGCAGEAVIHERNGLVVAIDEVNSLRDATRNLLQNPAFRERLSTQAVVDAASWSFERRAGEQVAFYANILTLTRSRYGSGRSGGR